MRHTRPFRTNTPKRCPFHFKGLECKSRTSRNTWSNRQIWPWSKSEAGQRLTEFFQENAPVIVNTLFQQHKRRLYTWISPDGQHRNQIDYILCSQKWGSSIQSAKTRLGVDCGWDHELLIAKLRIKLKKVGKTTRSFRYDLNQILYDYTVEVTNRFKRLDLIECLKDYGLRFVTLYRRWWPNDLKGKEMQEGKVVIRDKYPRKEEKWKTREKGRDILNWMQSFRE